MAFVFYAGITITTIILWIYSTIHSFTYPNQAYIKKIHKNVSTIYKIIICTVSIITVSFLMALTFFINKVISNLFILTDAIATMNTIGVTFIRIFSNFETTLNILTGTCISIIMIYNFNKTYGYINTKEKIIILTTTNLASVKINDEYYFFNLDTNRHIRCIKATKILQDNTKKYFTLPKETGVKPIFFLRGDMGFNITKEQQYYEIIEEINTESWSITYTDDIKKQMLEHDPNKE